MALLPTLDRTRLAVGFMRDLSILQESCGFTKAQLLAAVAACDQWVEDNTASFNAALPAGFRTTATTEQKAALLAYVLWRRIGRLRVAEDT